MADRDLIPYSWNGNQINDGSDYRAGMGWSPWGLPPINTYKAKRTSRWPVLTGVDRGDVVISLWIEILGSDLRTLRDQLTRWFDPENETTANFVIEDEDGTNRRYVVGLCTRLEAIEGTARGFWVDIAVHDDPRWAATSETTDSWTITASGDTKIVSNPGTDEAYPTLVITPTSAKSGSSDYTYKRFVAIRWRVADSASKYPVDIANDSLDTATLVSGGKMQADGDDLRVKVDGTEVDRWLQDMNNATTQVWVNLDFSPKWEGTIVSAIGSGDTVTSIVVNESLTGLKDSGLVCINSEVFSFTAIDPATKTLTIGERASKGSTAANHSASDTIWWIQHDISIVYGNPSATAPSVDDDYKPIFQLNSTNTSWDYDYFGNNDGTRTASWTFVVEQGTNWYGTPLKKYTANRETDADPWEEMGIKISQWGQIALWKMHNPCGITNANFQGGEAQASVLSNVWASIRSASPDVLEDTIIVPATFPTTVDTWESWSDNEALQTGAVDVYIKIVSGGYKPEAWLEVSDVTLTLNSSNTPAITMHPEEASYSLVCRITNTTTGDAIDVDYSGLETNESITINTAEKTVTDDQDGSSQFQACERVGGPRKEWLRLLPGSNTLSYTDVNTAGVTIDISFRARYY